MIDYECFVQRNTEKLKNYLKSDSSDMVDNKISVIIVVLPHVLKADEILKMKLTDFKNFPYIKTNYSRDHHEFLIKDKNKINGKYALSGYNDIINGEIEHHDIFKFRKSIWKINVIDKDIPWLVNFSTFCYKLFVDNTINPSSISKWAFKDILKNRGYDEKISESLSNDMLVKYIVQDVKIDTELNNNIRHIENNKVIPKIIKHGNSANIIVDSMVNDVVDLKTLLMLIVNKEINSKDFTVETIKKINSSVSQKIEFLENDLENILYLIMDKIINILIFDIKTRKKISKLVLTYVDKKYFSDTNNFNGFIFDGVTFNQIFGEVTFKKILDELFQMNDHQYELGKNNNIKEEINYNYRVGPGLYFAQKSDIIKYLYYGIFIVTVTIPKDENVIVCIEDNKLKASTLCLSEKYDLSSIEKLEDFEKVKDFDEILRVSLVNQNLNDIPKYIFNCKNLLILDISENNISSISSILCELSSLQKINLSDNKIKDIPDDIMNLKNLKELNLQNNKITSVSKKIKYLTRITKINLSENKLSSIPYEINELGDLAELNLEDNEIEFLKIINLNKLKILNISKNNIKIIRLSNLPNLIDLNISYNKLETLEHIILLPSLQILYANDNEITEISNECSILDNLTELYVSNNKIKNLSDKIFNKIKNIDYQFDFEKNVDM